MGKLYSLVGILEVKGEDLIQALASPITDYEDAVVEEVARRSDMKFKSKTLWSKTVSYRRWAVYCFPF